MSLISTKKVYLILLNLGVYRAEGVFGAFIVRQAEDLLARAYEVDSDTHVLVLHDWIHKPALDKFAGLHHNTQDDYASTILINGKGRNSAAEVRYSARDN